MTSMSGRMQVSNNKYNAHLHKKMQNKDTKWALKYGKTQCSRGSVRQIFYRSKIKGNNNTCADCRLATPCKDITASAKHLQVKHCASEAKWNWNTVQLVIVGSPPCKWNTVQYVNKERSASETNFKWNTLQEAVHVAIVVWRSAKMQLQVQPSAK